MTTLDPQQQAAVESTANKTMVIAGAGSGKTRVLIARIEHLLSQGASPFEIVALTFTRKAAGEMKTRLEAAIGRKARHITMGTSHSIAAEMIRRYDPDRAGNTIYGPIETDLVLKDVAMETGVYKKAWKPARGVIDKAFLDYATTTARPKEGDPALDIFNAFQFRCRQNRALTYDDLLVEFHQLIPTLAKYLNWKHILVDECQDLTPLQWNIINDISMFFDASIFAVGDLDQCQPAGTKVLLADDTEINIEELDPSVHELRVYDKHDALICGGHNKGFHFSINSRKYSGAICDISAGGKQTACTGNHKWWVKWSHRSLNKNVVYLMKQGDRFRVGWCQLFSKKGNSHLSVRCRLENADAAWILGVFDTKKDASVYEQIISVRFGIPTIMFRPNDGCGYYDKEAIDYIFSEVGPLSYAALKCLSEHGKDISNPFWIKNLKTHRGAETVFGVTADNFEPDLFKVPVREGRRNIRWEDASISKRIVIDIVVYSLDVEKHHTYIADGICTRNSIYSFRGAVPDYMLTHCDDFIRYLLETNYRSLPGIVAAGNNVIRHNRIRVDKTSVAFRENVFPNLPSFRVLKDVDSAAIVDMIGADLEITGEITAEHEVAVLARNHYLLKKVSTLLTDAQIDHTYAGAKNDMLRELPAVTLHSFLRLCVNPNDNFSFMVIRKLLGVSDQQYAEIRLDATRRRVGHLVAWMIQCPLGTGSGFFFTSNSGKEAMLPEAMSGLIDLFQEISSGLDITPVVKFADAWIDSNEYEGLTIKNYLDYLALFDVQDELTSDEDAPKVTLSTIHAAKGLEFKTVIVAGLNEGIFPGRRAVDDDIELEAERNLAYVAFTRAEDRLFLTVRPERTVDAKGIEHVNQVSRFVGEAMNG
jgi:DNA helicase-2/ATP-dependent DNA helicase PcrA